jgi:NAD(P)-dependent dehydrogenase (short-subunit alcohol dehydrogenase family)
MDSQATAPSIDLTGQVAAVTGGGRGIGRAIAEAFASAGASVAVLARSTDELAQTVAAITQSGGRARAFQADVADPAAIAIAFAAIEQTLGPVDLLVNNAATPGPIGPLWEVDPGECWQAIEVNLRGPLLCARAVLPGMIARRRGRIINIVTGAIPIPYLSIYATGKAALMRFSECLAAETKPHGIAVFAMGPGTVRTAMSEHALNSPEGRKWLPWFSRIFDEHIDVPAERPARLALQLASGKMDALSGCLLSVLDDLDVLLKNVKEVEQDNLYSLRIRTLAAASSSASAAVAAIRAAAGRAVPESTDKRGSS